MVLKESKLFQISGFAKTVLLAITIVIAGCGGGGGSSSADPYQPSVDSTAPVITLQGGNPQAVDLNAEYQEAGASADTGETVVIDSTAVDTASVGSYTVTYNVTDAAGNQAAEKTRTVNVTDPTVTVNVEIAANNNGTGNVYVIDGVQKKSVSLEAGKTYKFVHPSGHPLRFSTTADGTHGGGVEYTEGVGKSASGETIIEVTASTPTTLYYFCTIHSGMGGPINVPSMSGWVAGQYDDWRSTSMRNICENPRTTSDFTDTQGTVTDENNWIRSYSNDTYLWYSELSDIDPGTVSSAEGYFDLMRTNGLSPTGNAKDQFHYSQNTEEYNQYYSGVSAGYGVRFFVIASSPPRQIIVGYNEPNGPAANNSLSRGAEIISVDGEAIVDSNNVDVLNGALFPTTVGESHTFVVRDLNATEDRTFTITSAETTTVPVKNISTLDVGGKKVGYLTFNAHIKPAETQLIDAITQLKANNIEELVLDMRYNGGGYLTIAAELGYMVAGSASEGEVFDALTFNDKYTVRDPINNNILEPSRFSSTAAGFDAPTDPTPPGTALPGLNLTRVFILASGGTASASEALINGLRGVDVEVILIGEATRGKPYGWYAIDNCGTTYSTIQFKGSNAKGFGDYSDGFLPVASADLSGAEITGCEVADDLSHALGDASEGRLAAALTFIETGSCPAEATSALSAKSGSIKLHPLSAVTGRLIQPELGKVIR